MKIRTQDANKFIHFCEGYIKSTGTGCCGVYIQNYYGKNGILAGVYLEEERARGVLHDVVASEGSGTKVFYMPLE